MIFKRLLMKKLAEKKFLIQAPLLFFQNRQIRKRVVLSLAAFNLLRSSLNRGGDGGLAPWPRSCSFINPPASFSSGVYCLLRPRIASLKRSKKINALYRLPFLG